MAEQPTKSAKSSLESSERCRQTRTSGTPNDQSKQLIPTRISAAYRGPVMTRAGLSLIASVAFLGFILAVLQNQLNFPALTFFFAEFSAAVLTLSTSWSQWFRRNWEMIALGNAFFVIIGITSVSIALGTLAGGVLGLLLLEVGSSAFLPWSPNWQRSLNGATIAGVVAFILIWPHGDPLLGLYCLTTLAGAVIAEVACSTLYNYRIQLEHYVQMIHEGRKALILEVRERGNVIARLRQTQEELVKKSEEALAATRAKSDFLSTMSHEIRTPMNSVLGMAELLGDADLKPRERRALEIIRQSGEMMLELMNSILDFARLETGRLPIVPKEFMLRAAVQRVIDTLTLAASEKSLELTAQFSAELPEWVIGDSLRLRQVLMNLVGNAIKFTSRGKITVTVAPASSAESNLYQFSVSDTGIGIPNDKLEMVFEPFTQVDSSNAREYGGSGLGLAIVENIVNEMGGEISVTSEVGRGSTFAFTVHFDPATDCKLTGQAAPLGAQQFQNLRRQLCLLVADDVAVNRALIRGLLGDLSCTIEEVDTGKGAFATFLDSKFDAILMDMQMPLQDGYEATIAIREWERANNAKPTPIIALTASVFDGDEARAISAGCDAHLNKPIKREDLLKVLNEQLAASSKSEGGRAE